MQLVKIRGIKFRTRTRAKGQFRMIVKTKSELSDKIKIAVANLVKKFLRRKVAGKKRFAIAESLQCASGFHFRLAAYRDYEERERGRKDGGDT